MANFTVVQQTIGPELAANPLIQAFSVNTKPNNCITVVCFAILGGLTGGAGPTTDVTDSQGNQYYAVQGANPFGAVQVYVAVDIKGGPCTVTGSGLGMIAFEISSATFPYYVCLASCQRPNVPNVVNTSPGFQAHSGGGPDVTSASECLVFFGADISAGSAWSVASGVLAYQGLCPGDFGGFGTAVGYEIVPSIPLVYTNNIKDGGNDGSFNYTATVIFNLTNTGCLAGHGAVAPAPSGAITGGAGGGGAGGRGHAMGCAPCLNTMTKGLGFARVAPNTRIRTRGRIA